MDNSELKKNQNVTIWEILGACALGAILGGGLITVFIIRTGWY